MMNINELKEKIKDLNMPQELYSVLKGGLPNECLCLTKEESQWQVYYSERGSKTGLKVFDNENDACDYFYRKLKRMSINK